MVLTIKGEHLYLWRAVDQEGNILGFVAKFHGWRKALSLSVRYAAREEQWSAGVRPLSAELRLHVRGLLKDPAIERGMSDLYTSLPPPSSTCRYDLGEATDQQTPNRRISLAT